MKNLHIDVRLGNFYALIKPLIWLLIIEVLLYLVFVVIPQGHDVYVYLLEEGFWSNAFTIMLLLIALVFLSVSSGFGGEMILALSQLKIETIDADQESKTDAFPTRSGTENLRNRIVTFLWYFPFLSFLIGFYDVILFQRQSDSEGFGYTAIFLTLLFSCSGLYLIFTVRKGLWAYIRKQMFRIHTNPDVASKLLRNFSEPLKLTKNTKSGEGEFVGESVNLKQDYKPFVNILGMFFAFSILLFIIFDLMPTKFYYFIGAAPLLVFGFGAWINLYLAVEMAEKIYSTENFTPFKFQYDGKIYSLSFKTLILIWILFCSFINSDNPVNDDFTINNQEYSEGPLRPTVSLEQNLAAYTQRFITKCDTPNLSKIPIIFIATDGGASRTGLFGATMLSVMQDSLPSIKNNIFAYSNISGGTVGANIFYGLAMDDLKTRSNSDTCYVGLVNRFFKRDFLAAIIGTYMFGETLGYFLPFYVKKFDRGIALEREWQSAWKETMPYLNQKSKNILEQSAREMLQIPDKQFKPVMFINSYEVETGKRAIYSNVQLPDSVFSGISNLNKNLRTDIPFSAAILFSARFPFISPSAKVQVTDFVKRHYVDGGYFESSGTLTLYEALKGLESKLDTARYNVFVIHLDSGTDDEPTEQKGISFLNEFADVANGAVQDRSGHTAFAVENLKNYVSGRYTKSHYITLSVGGSMKAVPVNWVLSGRAVDQVLKRCKKLWKHPQLRELQQIVDQNKICSETLN